MNRPFGGLSNGPLCEPGRLIVQVIGKHHRRQQKVMLRSANGESLWAYPVPLTKTFCSSVLHTWDDVLPGDRLCLEIESTEGEPIRLPLLDTLCLTPRQLETQWNQLVPVLPFVALPGSKSSEDLGTPVLVRAGFIYVFYQGQLWRELEVQVNDGKTTYHDVDTRHYRTGAGFTPGERKVTGVALQDIWLPARWNNQPVLDVQMCFSEIQLSGARLQRLEQDAGLRGQRCTTLGNLTCSNESFRDLYRGRPDGLAMLEAFSSFDALDQARSSAMTQAKVARLNLEGRCFPVSLVAPQRPREPGFEWLLEHPAHYLCDLSGEFPLLASQTAKIFLYACTRGSTQDNPPVQDTERLELSAVADALRTLIPADSSASADEPPAELWEVQDRVADVLIKARERQLCGVLLEDPRYRLRHLKMRLETHRQLLHDCAIYASQQPHHGSALLIQQMVVPRQWQGQPNPLHGTFDNASDKGKRQINCSTAVLERAMVWQHMVRAQDRLTTCLQQARTQQTLADHLSLDGFEYAAALLVISQTLATLAAPPSRLDPLSPGGEMIDALSGTHLYTASTAGQQWLSALANDVSLPLHPMLWPPSDLARVCQPYQKPDKPAQNNGDGHFRSSELAALEHQPLPSAEALTLDASIVDNLLSGGSLSNFLIVSGKNVSNALMSIHETLQGAVNVAQAAVETSRAALDQATRNAGSTGRPRPLSLPLQAQGIQQLRSLLPDTFGLIHLMPRNQVTRSHYLFGLEDLPSRQAKAPLRYGDFTDEAGYVLKDNFQAYRPGLPAPEASHLMLVMERNHSTVQQIAPMNRQLSEALQADAEAAAAASQVKKATSALGEAMEQFMTRSNDMAYRVLNSRPFATAVLMLEMWNVTVEIESMEQSSREKGGIRALGGFLSASLDLVIALEALTIKMVATQSALTAARRPILEISSKGATRWLGKAIADRFNKTVTARLIGMTFSGLMFTGLSLYDAWDAWKRHDNAMYGYLLMATGALVGTAAVWIITPAILGLPVLGWIALLMIGIGAGLNYLLSDTSLQDWLANGPFGSGSADLYPHLQDPLQAFYRLVSLLAGIRISVGPNPLFAPNHTGSDVPFKVRNANTRVRIESRLPGLLGPLGTPGITAEYRLHKVVVTQRHAMGTITEKTPYDEHIARPLQRLLPDALELYFQEYFNSDSRPGTRFEWAIRAQFSVPLSGQTLYFPAPPIKDPLQFGAEYAKPDFKKTNRPFWADEQTHKA